MQKKEHTKSPAEFSVPVVNFRWQNKNHRSKQLRSGGVQSLSFRFSRATLTASTTNAEKVQFFPLIAASTWKIRSLGKRIDLLVVGGIDGILNFFNRSSPRSTIVSPIMPEDKVKLCNAFALQTWPYRRTKGSAAVLLGKNRLTERGAGIALHYRKRNRLKKECQLLLWQKTLFINKYPK